MPGRPLEAVDRVFGVAGESMRPGGHVLGAGSPKYEVLRSDQKVSESDHLGLQRAHKTYINKQRSVFTFRVINKVVNEP